MQVQTYSSPWFWLIWGLNIQCMYIYCPFIIRGHTWQQTCQCCVFKYLLLWLSYIIFHFAMPFNSLLPQMKCKSLKVLLTCRWWTRGVNKPPGFTHFRQESLNFPRYETGYTLINTYCIQLYWWRRIYRDNLDEWVVIVY